MNARFAAARLSSIALAAALLAPALASAQNVATVNGKAVPKARVETLINQITKQGNQPRTPELERQVKDEVVLREIFVQEAEKRGLAASATYREQMELLRQTVLIRELFADYEKKNPVTDADIKAEYDKFKAQAGDAKEYHTRHILVEKEEEAKALIVQIKGGGSFEELAKKNSKDPGSAPNGGDLDWSPANAYVPEFSQAMAKLGKGQMTDEPVKSSFGWHIIKVEDIRDVQLPSLEEVTPQIKQRLTKQKLVAFREDLQKKAKTDYKFGAN